MVSPASSTPRPPAPSVQQATALPGKCPPTRTTDNDGVSCKVSDHCWITGSGRITHSASAAFTYTGTPPSRWLHSTCAPYMCGWLATMAMTGPRSVDRGHCVVVDKAGRIPQHVAGIGAHQLSQLSDSERRRTADRDESVLNDRDLRPHPFGDQLLQRRPLLTLSRHPLPVVGTNRAHARCGAVLDTAGSAQPKHGTTLFGRTARPLAAHVLVRSTAAAGTRSSAANREGEPLMSAARLRPRSDSARDPRGHRGRRSVDRRVRHIEQSEHRKAQHVG